MKKIAIAFAAIVITLGAAPAQARDYCEDGGYRTTIVITGRDRCGQPVYAERFLIRFNSHGNPLFGYRPVAPRGGYGGGRDGGYEGGRDGGYDRRRDDGDRGDRYDRGGYDRRDDRRGDRRG